MNFLAHFSLADDSHASRIGNVLGDFTNTPNNRVCEKYGHEVGAGIIRHRAVDMFNDSHPLFMRSVSLLFPRHRHYAHLIVDILNDYFLSKHWNHFHKEPLDDFIRICYQSLSLVDDAYPSRFVTFAQRFPEYDIMRMYRTLDGVQEALGRTAQRLSRRTELHDVLGDIKKNYDELEEGFLGLYPAVMGSVGEVKA